MASSIARPFFTFFTLSRHTLTMQAAQKFPKSPHQVLMKPLLRPRIVVKSTDVSKEEKQELTAPLEEDDPPNTFDKRRPEEKFVVVSTGIYECRSCGYKYDEAIGDPSYPIPPGLPYDKLPEDWRCPTCGASQTFFESKKMEIAGFAENQQFGLGGNSLTSGQKALVIYGSLLFFFFLFLSGYFIQ